VRFCVVDRHPWAVPVLVFTPVWSEGELCHPGYTKAVFGFPRSCFRVSIYRSLPNITAGCPEQERIACTPTAKSGSPTCVSLCETITLRGLTPKARSLLANTSPVKPTNTAPSSREVSIRHKTALYGTNTYSQTHTTRSTSVLQ